MVTASEMAHGCNSSFCPEISPINGKRRDRVVFIVRDYEILCKRKCMGNIYISAPIYIVTGTQV